MRLRTWLLLLTALMGTLPSWAQDEIILTPERVLHFDSNLQVNTDASLLVTETITVTAIGDQIKHGLVRKFPVRYQTNQGQTIEVGFELKQALCNGQPEPYRLEREADMVLIYVGRKNAFLNPGVYTYTLVYLTRRQLGFFPDYDELYWNVTGSQWPFNIEKASARVDLPTGAQVLHTAGYTGAYGSQTADLTKSWDEHMQPLFATSHPLRPGEGMTVAVSWPRGFVVRPNAREQFLLNLQAWLPWPGLLSLSTLLSLLLFYGIAWKWGVSRPRPGAPLPSLTPPAGVSPAEARYLWRKYADDKTLAASLLHLAVRGFLVIVEKQKKISLLKNGQPRSTPTPAEQAQLSVLFNATEVLELHPQNAATVQAFNAAVTKPLKSQWDKLCFKSYRHFVLWGCLLCLAGLGVMLCLATDVGNAASMGLFWIIWALITTTLAKVILSQFSEALAARKVSLWAVYVFLWLLLAFMLALAHSTWPRVAEAITPLGALAWVLIPGIHLAAWRFFKVLTPAGQSKLDQLLGFRQYLLSTEKTRLALTEQPENSPLLFEKYLAFAVALNAEKTWSARFLAALTNTSEAQTAYVPNWYLGRTWNSAAWLLFFTSNLSLQFTDAVSSAAAPPGTNSGSTGGGFAGGGAGGGGGGGW